MGNPRKCLAYTGKSKNKIDDLGVPPFQEPSHTHIYIYYIYIYIYMLIHSFLTVTMSSEKIWWTTLFGLNIEYRNYNGV